MVLTGTFEHAIDAQNRLAIPSELRRQIVRSLPKDGRDDESVVLYITVGGDGVLLLYTEEMFDRRATQLDSSPQDRDEVLDYEYLFYTQSRMVELDKQGRVRLPVEMLEQTGLSGDVVVLGVKDHIEIRDRGAWQAQFKALMARRSGRPMNPRGLIG